jgi:hypothetical protein
MTKVPTLALLACLLPVAALALTPYSQTFEGLVQDDPDALSGDGWLVFGNVSQPDGTYLYGYGPFPAPNSGAAFCQVVSGQGGPEQGDQQLVVFSDYENTDHASGLLIESNVFQEQTIEADAVGQAWRFAFQAKRGNLEGQSTAIAFIKTLDPQNNYALTNFEQVELTAAPQTWQGYELTLSIDAELEGQILQFGFACVATDYQGSGVFYDNLLFEQDDQVDVPDVSAAAGAELRQNYPNPFNPVTRIDFRLDRAGPVQLAVYDLAGRLVTTLHRGALPAGPHHVTWDGRSAAGEPVASGLYRYVLVTDGGRVARTMILTK